MPGSRAQVPAVGARRGAESPRRPRNSLSVLGAALAATLLLVSASADGGSPSPAAVNGAGTVTFATGGEPRDPDLRRAIEAYVGLYRADRLDDWKRLLHPALSVADPRPDGGIRSRGLEDFFATQKGYFATGRSIGERLENVRVEEGRRIARVAADFVFVDDGRERRGRLGLHLARDDSGWRIVAILFSYDEP